MTEIKPIVNRVFSVAPLRNVIILNDLTQRLLQRDPGLPGMGCFAGPSGYGKSVAVMYAANKHRAYSVQANAEWTKRHMCRVILREMGAPQVGTVPEMVEAIGRELDASQRPLFIDEADTLVSKTMIETVRAIYEESGGRGVIILVGEENLPRTLERWERIHSRMQIGMELAEPCGLEDCSTLARLRCPGIVVAEDLLAEVCKVAAGSTRRAGGNLDVVYHIAQGADLDSIDLKRFAAAKGAFASGKSPVRGK